MPGIRRLLSKFASGTCSREEFDELMLLFQQEQYEAEIRQALKDIYGSLGAEIFSDIQINRQGGFVDSGKTFGKVKKRYLLQKIAIAAFILLPVSLAIYLLFIKHAYQGGKPEITQIATQGESKTSLILPDGSKVWLNSYSTLTYSTGFDNGKREVTLIGEALFDVKHDSLLPFVVHTKNFDVTDMGTVFNVQSYPEDPVAVASLISGSIEVTFKEKQKEKIILVPNQKITVQNDSETNPNAESKQLLVKTSIVPDPQTNIMPDTAWMARKMIFKDLSFYDLSLQMQRRYGVKIIFNEPSIGEYTFTGRFDDETIEEALHELQMIAPFTYTRQKSDIYIKR